MTFGRKSLHLVAEDLREFRVLVAGNTVLLTGIESARVEKSSAVVDRENVNFLASNSINHPIAAEKNFTKAINSQFRHDSPGSRKTF